MSLRAIILTWEEPRKLAASDRARLADFLADQLDAFPPEQEVPTSDTPVPASTVALSHVSTETTISVTPWVDPPLANADRAVCFESSDGAALAGMAEHCRKAFDAARGISVLPVEVRDRRYTSATIATIAYDPALGRQSRTTQPEVLLWPCRRTPAWWALSPLQRQAMFLPRLDADSNIVAPGHVQVSEPIVPLVHRRLYHESLSPGEQGVMLGWFETATLHLGALRSVVADLQDVKLAPDHAYYQSGPLWWGKRVAVDSVRAELG